MMRVFVTAYLNGQKIAGANGMLRESVEFTIKSVLKQLDNGLVEELKIDEKSQEREIVFQIALQPTNNPGRTA